MKAPPVINSEWAKCAKRKIPKISVFNGVKEFRMELTVLSIWVWAIAKR